MNNDWIIWNGGECPVPGKRVQIQLRCQTRFEAELGLIRYTHQRQWEWAVDGNEDFDIIAYRLIPEPLWAKLTARVSDFGGVWAGGMDMIGHTHLLRIPMKLIDGKRVIDDSRQPVMEKL